MSSIYSNLLSLIFDDRVWLLCTDPANDREAEDRLLFVPFLPPLARLLHIARPLRFLGTSFFRADECIL